MGAYLGEGAQLSVDLFLRKYGNYDKLYPEKMNYANWLTAYSMCSQLLCIGYLSQGLNASQWHEVFAEHSRTSDNHHKKVNKASNSLH